MSMINGRVDPVLGNPHWLTLLFSSTEYAWMWLIARLYLGVEWLSSGGHKLVDPGWMGNGASLRAFWTSVTVVPSDGQPAVAYDGYRGLLQFMLNHGWYVWFGKLVAVGETAVGIALLVGLVTGIAALFGAVMSWNYMLAGTASANPVLGILGLGVLAAWKIAGWWGLDRWVLPRVGAPWQPGSLFSGKRSATPGQDPGERREAMVEWVRIAMGGALLASALAYLSGWVQVVISLLGMAVLAADFAGRAGPVAGHGTRRTPARVPAKE